MQQEIRFATFNVYNLAPPGQQLYDNLLPATPEQYEAKLNWTARQIDLLDADVIGFQEIFSQAVLREALSRTEKYRDAVHVGFDPDPAAERLTPSVALVSRLPLAAPGVAVVAGARQRLAQRSLRKNLLETDHVGIEQVDLARRPIELGFVLLGRAG